MKQTIISTQDEMDEITRFYFVTYLEAGLQIACLLESTYELIYPHNVLLSYMN
jgi:hypothetical protein